MSIQKTINKLIIAIVQAQDSENVINELNRAGFFVTRLSSTGGFLGRGNVTLLVGIDDDQKKEVLDILKHLCRRRVEYIATPLEGSPFHLPLPTPVSVGGATVFMIPVEHCEVIS